MDSQAPSDNPYHPPSAESQPRSARRQTRLPTIVLGAMLGALLSVAVWPLLLPVLWRMGAPRITILLIAASIVCFAAAGAVALLVVRRSMD